jgi:hypothetical protein
VSAVALCMGCRGTGRIVLGVANAGEPCPCKRAADDAAHEAMACETAREVADWIERQPVGTSARLIALQLRSGVWRMR